MKKLFCIFLFFLFSQFNANSNERDKRLNQLFNELKVNQSNLASIIEQEIWTLWSTHPTNEKLTARLEEGSKLVRSQKLNKAKNLGIKIMSEVEFSNYMEKINDD